MPAYGYRARIGYTVPIRLAEVFPFDFYRIAPPGVSLMLATMSVWERTEDELQASAEASLRAIREMAAAGASVVVFGGVPVNFALGGSIESTCQALEGELGIPITASLLCQNAALQAVGAKNVVMLRPASGGNDEHAAAIQRLGCQVLETAGLGRTMAEQTRLTTEETLGAARALLRRHPNADTLHCSSPHWPMAPNIQPLEDEFGVTVITAGQAITWRALRLAGIQDAINGYGRLLREF